MDVVGVEGAWGLRRLVVGDPDRRLDRFGLVIGPVHGGNPDQVAAAGDQAAADEAGVGVLGRVDRARDDPGDLGRILAPVDPVAPDVVRG